MAAEARRIQESAKYEAEIRAAEMRLRAEDEAEEGFIGFVSDSEPDDEPWIKDYYLSKPAPQEVASTPQGALGWQSSRRPSLKVTFSQTLV